MVLEFCEGGEGELMMREAVEEARDELKIGEGDKFGRGEG